MTDRRGRQSCYQATDRKLLIKVSTTAAALTVFTSLIGFAGILLNNRPFLAVYTILLWVCLALIVAPGYLTYKQRTFNLEGKINAQWSRDLGLTGRLRIQNAVSIRDSSFVYRAPQMTSIMGSRSLPAAATFRHSWKLRLPISVMQDPTFQAAKDTISDLSAMFSSTGTSHRSRSFLFRSP